MKRFTAIFLLCIYMVASMGVTMQSHYCMGRHVSTAFQLSKPLSTCPMCGMKKTRKGCCEEKIQSFELQGDQQVSSSTFNFAAPTFDILLPQVFAFLPQFSYQILSDVALPLSHAPPNLLKVALHLFNCVLIN